MLWALLMCLPALATAADIPMFEVDCVNSKSSPSTDSLIRSFGYPVERHSTATADGYILGLFRIPNSSSGSLGNKPSNRTKPAILLLHGMGQNPNTFLLQRKGQLPLLLADKGFDVWLGSSRGTSASAKHVRLSASSSAFWDFSWHENGVYDVPAMVTYMKRVTGQRRVQVVGYSLGTTTVLVMCSLLPERCREDISHAYLIAPTAYLGHSKGAFAAISKVVETPQISKQLATLSESVLHGAILFNGNTRRLAFKLCSSPKIWSSCLQGLFAIVGPSLTGAVDRKTISSLLCLSTDNLSVKTPLHYAQHIVKGDDFRQYDYKSPQENMRRYGSPSPPSYPLEKVSIPLSLYVSAGDLLVQPSDLKKAVARLPNIQRIRQVPLQRFTHIDFILQRNVTHLVYEQVVADTLKDSTQNNSDYLNKEGPK